MFFLLISSQETVKWLAGRGRFSLFLWFLYMQFLVGPWPN
jgi:hypothetical protein